MPQKNQPIYRLTSVIKIVYIFFPYLLFQIYKRRKTTRLKYDPPYIKKPMAKYAGPTALVNHHNAEEVSLDGSNKLVYGNIAPFR